MWKKFKSENTNEKIVLKKYTLNKKLLEESSRNVYSEYLEDSTGKEELYLRKIKHFDVWDYYSSNYEIMFIQLFWIIKSNYMQIYILMKKQEAT